MTREIRSSARGDTTSAPSRDDEFAAQLRGLGPVGVLAILVIVLAGNLSAGGFLIPAGALLVLAWARLSHTPWREIGYSHPRNWIVTVVAGLLLGIALKLISKAVVLPLLGADPVNQTYHYLAGNRALIPATLWTMLIVGFAEETVFRGFLFERLGRILGASRRARVVIVLITSVLFGAAHYVSQGLTGVEQATLVSLAYGAMFAATGNLWMPIIAHSAFDLTAYGLIYWNLEADVANLIFG